MCMYMVEPGYEGYEGRKEVKTLNPLALALQGLERRLLTTGVAVLFPRRRANMEAGLNNNFVDRGYS